MPTEEQPDNGDDELGGELMAEPIVTAILSPMTTDDDGDALLLMSAAARVADEVAILWDMVYVMLFGRGG